MQVRRFESRVLLLLRITVTVWDRFES